jgi:YD repeat-containing protein
MELWLAPGMLTEQHTDFFLPGRVPIRFERAINNMWQTPAAFGLSGSHNYDRYLLSDDELRHISIATPSFGRVELTRVPESLNVLALNKWVDKDASENNLVLKWRTSTGVDHFYLTRYNGEVETYMPCTAAEMCYLSGYRNGKGDVLKVERDPHRNLMSLSAPEGNWLHFTHDPDPLNAIRVTEIQDNTGRHVLYGYNAKGQLATVTYSSGQVFTYEYDDNQDLLSVSVSPRAAALRVTLIRNTFENGRLTKQTLPDGRVYTYSYAAGDANTADSAQVIDPDGNVFNICFMNGYAIVRQEPKPQPDGTP